ncbi:MAG: porin family protein [Deltaproteobacteria bacterium]|nr:porin family protein [Deltaproteobacteria bacterium]
MSTKRLLVAAIAAAALTTSARAAEVSPRNFYVGANLGLAIFHSNDITAGGGSASVSYKSGLGFAGALGYRINEAFRAEFELAYRNNKVDKIGSSAVSGTDVTVWSYMLNGYYDFAIQGVPVKPFVVAGLGLATGKIDSPAANDSDTEFAYQLGLGVKYLFDQHFSVQAQYRYQGSQTFSKNGVDLDYGSSTIFAGATYQF